MNRRNFFRKTVVAGALTISIPEIVRAALPATTESDGINLHYLSQGNTILFQGDSITDGRRNREREDLANDQAQLGGGYPLFASASMLASHPGKELKIYNRGISGNKVFQLAARWEKDCLQLQPDILSILIGVNDYWHLRNGNYDGTVEVYEADYSRLIEETRKALPETKIVICEPFLIHGGTALNDTWEAAFAPYRKVARKVADNFDLAFIPFQTVFNEALKSAPAAYWGADGVHPSMAGAQLMAQAWQRVVL